MKYIESRRSPFSDELQAQLHNFVTKEVMSNEIKTDLLHLAQRGKETSKNSIQKGLLKKSTQLQDIIDIVQI